MSCEDLRAEYGAWALGIAGEPELSEIAAHLARSCPDCTAGVRSALVTTAALSAAVKDAEPPARLRRKVAAMVAPEPARSFTLIPWAISAVLAIALVIFATMGRKPTADSTKLAQALTILNDPAAKDVSFGQPSASGRVFVSPKGVVLIAAHLPTLQADRTFELWLIPASGKPVPAGTFNGESDSSAVYVYPGQTSGASAIAVTVEPAGGSPQPTTTPFIVSKL